MSHERRQYELTNVCNVDCPTVLHRLGVLVEHEAGCEDHEDDFVRSERVQGLIFVLGLVKSTVSIKEQELTGKTEAESDHEQREVHELQYGVVSRHLQSSRTGAVVRSVRRYAYTQKHTEGDLGMASS